MPSEVPFWVVALAVGILVVVTGRFAAYKVRYTYSAEDISRARKDAVRASRVTRDGQAAEHLAPFLPGLFETFNPKDARFIATPVDFVIFDGLEEGELRRIVFAEVKSGIRDDLSKRQREVRDVIEGREVWFEHIRLGLDTRATGSSLPRHH
jgi:predicted Holliday junction resolvase-like endonuclease